MSMMFLLKYIAAGFFGAGILILLAKGIMARLLQRREDYYEECGGSDGSSSDGNSFAGNGFDGGDKSAGSGDCNVGDGSDESAGSRGCNAGDGSDESTGSRKGGGEHV